MGDDDATASPSVVDDVATSDDEALLQQVQPAQRPVWRRVVAVLLLVLSGIILAAAIGQLVDTDAWLDADPRRWYVSLKNIIITAVVPLVVAAGVAYAGALLWKQ